MTDLIIQIDDNFRIHLVGDDESGEGSLTLDKRVGENQVSNIAEWDMNPFYRFARFMESCHDCVGMGEEIAEAYDPGIFEIAAKGAADIEDAIEKLIEFICLCTSQGYGTTVKKVFSEV